MAPASRNLTLFATPGRAHEVNSRRTRVRRLALEILEERRLLATFTVSNTGDNNGTNPAPFAGTGTLRQAIIDANKTATAGDEIAFAINASGVQTITLAAALPKITAAVVLDATTQTGYAGTPRIVLNGANAGSGTSGLTISANGCTIRGLAINRFGNTGMVVNGNDNRIAGDFIGINSSGTTALPNAVHGIDLYGAHNTVGGGGTNDPDVISGNKESGVFIDGTSAIGNWVLGDMIGTDVTGTHAVGNRTGGITIEGGATDNRIGPDGNDPQPVLRRNIISGNGENGVFLGDSGTSGNVVSGDYIGTDATGTQPISNGQYGVKIVNGATNNLIGTDGQSTDDAAEGDLISGNSITGVPGVYITDSGTDDNVVAGNLIGTDATGTKALGNGGCGVFLLNGASDNIIGTSGDGVGDNADEGNVIAANPYQGIAIYGSGTNNNVVAGNKIGTDITGTQPLGNQNNGIWILNGAQGNRIGVNAGDPGATAEPNEIGANAFAGIELSDASTDNNTIDGNLIGTDPTGTIALGNGDAGVGIDNGATDNTVGGTAAGLGNTIAFNDYSGIELDDDATVGNPLRGNIIYQNHTIAIDLNGDGVSPNHAGNALGSGPNDLQNYPIITSDYPGSTTTVSGTLSGLSSTKYTIDVYAAPRPDTSYFGAATIYLGSTQVTTNATGDGTFTASLPVATTAGEWVSVTATSPTGDTSEFSAAETLPWSGLATTTGTWTSLGPAPIGNDPEFAGRIEVAAADPSNPNVMYVGADGGGIWKTTDWLDPNPIWTPLTDNMPSLATGSGNGAYQALAVAPSNPNIVYAAVGGPGGGILESTNAGASWTELANAQFDQESFGTLLIDPTNAQTLYVSAWWGTSPGGVYKSTNGGQTWTNTTGSIFSGSASDIGLVPGSPSTLYAGLVYGATASQNGVYVSTNGGTSWTQLTQGLPAGSNIGGSIKIAVAPSSTNTVYATIFDTSSNPNRYVTEDGGTSWNELTALPGTAETRTWHVLLAVDPNHPNIVYANGSYTLYESTDSGVTWSGPYFDDDGVGGSFDDSGAFVLVGDRGIYRWTGGSAQDQFKQGNLDTGEFYTLTLDPTNPSRAYGIAQDQLAALEFTGSTTWNYLVGGDEVGKILVDPDSPNILYNFDPNVGGSASSLPPQDFVQVSDDDGVTWTAMSNNLNNTAVAGYSYAYASQKAFVMDPSNPNRLLLGTNHVFEWINGGSGQWTDISPSGLPNTTAYVTALAIAPSASQTVYAATQDGKLYVTTNDGGAWTEIDSGLSGDEIGSIVVDPNNPSHAFICTDTWVSDVYGATHVWTTTNAGTSWTEVTGNLPGEDWTTSLAVDWRPATPILYVGTARGVFNSAGGTNWTPYGASLPNVVVTDLQFLPQFNLLAAATFGRGVFEISTAAPATQLVVTTQPPNPVTAGAGFSIVVKAEDAKGDVDTGYQGSITLGLVRNPGNDTLGGQVTMNATNGVATFSNLTLTVAANNVQIGAISGGLSGTSQLFNVVPGAIHNFVVAGYPSPTTAGAAHTFTATAYDSYHNVVTTYTGTVHVSSTDPQAALPADVAFSASDNGVHTFTATLDTAGTQSLTVTDTSQSPVTGTQPAITVQPAVMHALNVVTAATATAGVAQSVLVTAVDAYNNTVPTYAGTVHFTSTDSNAVLPADYAFTSSDQGSHTFSTLTFKTAGTQAVRARDTVHTTYTGVQTGIAVSPAAASTFLVGFPTTTTAGVAVTFKVTVQDAFGNTVPTYTGTVHFTSTDTKATLPADYLFTASDAGIHSFTATLTTAGTRTITVTDTAQSTTTGTSKSITVSPSSPAALLVTYPTAMTAGTTLAFVVTAVDAYNNTVPTYTGTVHFTSTDTKVTLPVDYPFQTTDKGTHTFAIALKTAGTQAIRARDTQHTTITGVETGIAVSPAGASMMTVGFPTATVAGVAHGFAVTVYDAYQNVVTGYAGTVHFTSSDSTAVLPSDYAFTASDAGAHTFVAALKKAGTWALRATDSAHGSITGVVSNIVVSPASASLFWVSYPTSTTAGTAQAFVVTAKDAYGNTATGYTGTVHLTSSDSHTTLPADVTFTAADQGVYTFSVTLVRAGAQAIRATDTQHASITGTQTGITVIPAAASKVVVSGYPTSTTIGTANNFLVTLYDAYGNIATGYTGTIQITSDDPAIVIAPVEWTYGSSDAGQHTFSATFNTQGTHKLTATDTKNASLTASETSIEVS
jgi:hypothetical protein